MKLTRHLPQISLCISLAVAVLLIILVVQGRSAAASRDQGLRTFICYFEQAVLKSPHETPAQQRTAIRFFDNVMAKLREPTCAS